MSLDQNIISYIMEYKKISKELNALKNEIKQYRNRLKPRILELEKNKKKFSDDILKYLNDHNDPAVQFQDTIFVKDVHKKFPSKEEKQNQLDMIAEKYNISTVILEDLKKAIRPKKIIKDNEFTLKIMNTNSKIKKNIE
jgi:hypothetical protein